MTAGSRMAPDEPYYGVNAGQVVIRAVCGRVVLDRGEIVQRTAWNVAVRRPGGQTTVWPLLRVRVEPAAEPARRQARTPGRGRRART